MLLHGKNIFSSAFTTVAAIFHEWKTVFKYFFSELLHVDYYIEIYIITKTAGCAYQGVRNAHIFSGNCCVLFSCNTVSRFALLAQCRRTVIRGAYSI